MRAKSAARSSPVGRAISLAVLLLVLGPIGSSAQSAGEFLLPPSVSFSSTTLSAKPLEPKPLALSLFNPAENQAALEATVLLKLPSGVHVASSDFAAAGPNQAFGQFRVPPGIQRYVQLTLSAEESGSRTVEAQVTYRVEGRNGTPRTLQHSLTFDVEPQAEPPVPPTATEASPRFSIDLRLTSWHFWLLVGSLALLLVVVLRR